jgi:cell division protease FtsH
MSKKIGLLSYHQGEDHRFLGKEIIQDKDFSEKTAQIIDEEVKGLIDKKREYVTELLNEKKNLLIDLAESLLKDETLEFKKINEILNKNS